jgi:ATP-dependent Clp protease ATP-binding subunit ClpX
MESPTGPHAQGKKLTPSAITNFLNQYVVGQDDAKHVLSVAVYSHFRRLGLQRQNSVEIVKSNILLIGPTGTGKTLLCETLSHALHIPFAIANATSLAQSKYVNEEIEALMVRLLNKADGDLARAQHGIVFIDEIDKLKAAPGDPSATSGERVQHALLKIMEGGQVRLNDGRSMDTTGILFICAGAFDGIEKITSTSHAYGYISMSGSDNQKIMNRLNARIKPSDLSSFGLIPEFSGRLPIIASLQQLSRELLVRIMIEPRNSLYNQFRAILKEEGVELHIEHAVFEQIAEIASEYKVGARSLRGIFEEMLLPVLYQVPDRTDVRKVVISSLFEEAQLIST